MRVLTIVALLAFAPIACCQTPQYDLVLKGGHVIDPAGQVDRVMDIAVQGGRIARVAAEIPAAEGRKTVALNGLYVTPGLIDLHVHVYAGPHPGSLFPDSTALVTGATTVVDCGSSGWRTFEDFKAGIIDRSKTRVLAFLNILGWGMTKGAEAENNVEDMDPQATAAKIRQYPGLLVGVKTAHFGRPGYEALKRAVEAGRLSGKPVIVDDRITSNTARTTRQKLLEVLRPGDLHSHTYNDRQLELLDRFTGKVQPYMWEARKRGVLFDLGHGAGSLLWPVATRAMQQGFPPDTISSDLHAESILTTQSDMPNCISKLINLGMTLPEAIRRSTVVPAGVLKRFPELGTLGEGRTADIAVFRLETGVFAFKDAWEKRLMGTKKLECVLTVRNGEIVHDLDGMAFPLWRAAGDSRVRTPPAGQEVFDLLLKNGRVIDPKSGRSGRFDIAILGDKIARIGKDLPVTQARNAVDVSQYYVTPGLLDLHTHFNTQGGGENLQPDPTALSHGVTTAVDAGSCGWKNFEAFRENVIARSKTRLLAFLNIAGAGVYGAADELDPEAAARMARKHRDVVVGIAAHHEKADGGEVVERALKAAELSQSILMAAVPPSPDHLRPGDIQTHCYGLRAALLDAGQKVRPQVREARRRGALFDAAHGAGFLFRLAVPAIEQGFLPDTISTGADKESILLPRADMMTTLSKFLNLGLTLEQVIERATVNPARAIRRPELGTLAEGAVADLAVLELRRGRFGFLDSGHDKLEGEQKLFCVLTVRAGEVVWDREGLTQPEWKTASGPYQLYYTNYK